MAKQGSRHEVAKECIRKEENGSVKMFSLFFLCIFHVTKRDKLPKYVIWSPSYS
ncbi:hypothetical protein LEMLEM_LOCUS10131 [Lemmus lemmus]